MVHVTTETWECVSVFWIQGYYRCTVQRVYIVFFCRNSYRCESDKHPYGGVTLKLKVCLSLSHTFSLQLFSHSPFDIHFKLKWTGVQGSSDEHLHVLTSLVFSLILWHTFQCPCRGPLVWRCSSEDPCTPVHLHQCERKTVPVFHCLTRQVPFEKTTFTETKKIQVERGSLTTWHCDSVEGETENLSRLDKLWVISSHIRSVQGYRAFLALFPCQQSC